ncbi:serine-aspartate repeat-containing protein C [Eupeodes corollae]|uniref:serine-aspartate repeat-containing protein C n=1 Tax=Eupeodes corollae TaxID=290404 RepID=UPI00249052FA|nr:serine-aspartate repeat-containing protein C [Eupeodes corollae]
MSNSLFLDESNGNGVFATKAQATNLNITNTLPTSTSNEDLSQSLSEYTDADESMSAPTEFLAEFLSAVMLKDYKKALKYCKLILQYEPNNATAKEFRPLIVEKLKGEALSDSDENYNKSSSSPEMALDQSEEDVSNGSEEESDSNQSDRDDADADADVDCDNSSGENADGSRRSSSRSSGLAGESISDSEDVISSDDLEDNNLCVLNSRNSSSTGGSRSRSDNTTHSYSSLLLEEEDDIVPNTLHLSKELSAHDMDISNGNKVNSTSCSDSESPTEPLTQRLAAILRSKCGVNDGKN